MGKPQSTGNLVNALAQDSSNNIGIGAAANASFKLQVTGATNLTGALTGAAATFSGNLLVGPTTSGFDSVSQIASSSTGNIISALTLQNTSLTETAGTGVNLNFGGRLNWLGRISTQFVGTTGGGDASMSFLTPSGGTLAARLTISSTGSVGIGTTPPTTSNFPHLFSGRNFVTFSGSSNDVYIGSNFYYNGGFLARYSEPSIMINSSNGDIIFGNSASGTAGGALTVTEKMRITSGGRVGIGQTAPGIALSVAGQSEAWQFGVTTATGTSGALIGSPSANVLAFGDWSGSEKARILPDGQFCMNTTTALTAGWLCISVNSNNYNAIVLRDTGTSYSAGNYYQVFTNSSNTISGSISHNTITGVNFNTSSDYRLKEDFKDFNGLDILSNIKFYDFKWKQENKRMHGVIAHELESIIPLAVSGTKNAIDEEGNIVAQGVDYSKIVPILGKAIQELKAEIEQLKQK